MRRAAVFKSCSPNVLLIESSSDWIGPAGMDMYSKLVWSLLPNQFIRASICHVIAKKFHHLGGFRFR